MNGIINDVKVKKENNQCRYSINRRKPVDQAIQLNLAQLNNKYL